MMSPRGIGRNLEGDYEPEHNGKSLEKPLTELEEKVKSGKEKIDNELGEGWCEREHDVGEKEIENEGEKFVSEKETMEDKKRLQEEGTYEEQLRRVRDHEKEKEEFE